MTFLAVWIYVSGAMAPLNKPVGIIVRVGWPAMLGMRIAQWAFEKVNDK